MEQKKNTHKKQQTNINLGKTYLIVVNMIKLHHIDLLPYDNEYLFTINI